MDLGGRGNWEKGLGFRGWTRMGGIRGDSGEGESDEGVCGLPLDLGASDGA